MEIIELTLDDVFRLYENRTYMAMPFAMFCDSLLSVGVRIV